MTGLEIFAWGVGGSLAVEVVAVVRHYDRSVSRLPHRYREPGFYVARLLLAAIAGGMAVAYGIENRLLALHVGAATPLLVQAFAQTSPPVPPS